MRDATGKPRVIPNPYLRYENVSVKANDSLIAGNRGSLKTNPHHKQHHSSVSANLRGSRGSKSTAYPGQNTTMTIS